MHMRVCAAIKHFMTSFFGITQKQDPIPNPIYSTQSTSLTGEQTQKPANDKIGQETNKRTQTQRKLLCKFGFASVNPLSVTRAHSPSSTT